MESGMDHKFNFTEGNSLTIYCKDQKEVDYYWSKLTADGGVDSQCGWVKDKFGVSWQITPTILMKLASKKDFAKTRRMNAAMIKMRKLDIKTLQEAYDGK